VLLTRRTILLCLVAVVPVLAGGVVGAFAGDLLPGNDLVSRAPTGTSMEPSQDPVIDPVAGIAAVGLDEGDPLGAVRRPAGGPLVPGPPQENGHTDVGPQLVGPDGTITAIWSSSDTHTLHAARLAPGATTWAPVADVAEAVIGPRGAVIAPDGTITAVTYHDGGAAATIVSRALPAGAAGWEAPVTIKTLASGAAVDGGDGAPQIVRSPGGVIAAGWSEESSTGQDEAGGALRAAGGSWPAMAQDLVGEAGAHLSLGAIAVPDSGRSARLIFNELDSSQTPEVRIVPEQLTDSGPVPMNGIPAPSQGEGSFFAVGAVFTPDDTLRIVGVRQGGISESDVPPTHNGQLPEAPYTVVDVADEIGSVKPVLARLPDGEMLLSYVSESGSPELQYLQLLTRPAGGSWSAPRDLQPPIDADGSEAVPGGIAVDAGGDAYVTWSEITHTKAALAGAILDNTPPVIEGLSLPTATVGTAVQLGVTAHDAWSSTSAHWNLGDGSAADGEAPVHVYQAPGVRTVEVTVADGAGNVATTTGEVTVAAPQASSPPVAPGEAALPDRTAPTLAISQPPCAKKISKADCRKLRGSARSWHAVHGSVADAGGVASVTLQATSGSGKKCVVLGAGGKSKAAACATAAKLEATIRGGQWTVKTPGFAKGTWKLTAVATDRAGNTTAAHLTLRLTP
jgi:PKD repeat protein